MSLLLAVENKVVSGKRRKQLRLKEYDYSQAGAYFVTICTYHREMKLGKISEGVMILSPIGEIAKRCWKEIPNHFPSVVADVFVVMPNHIHGIIVMLGDTFPVGARSPRPQQTTNRATERRPYKKTTLGNVVGYFKYQSTKRISEIRNTSGTKIWQRNYFDHIIRDEQSFNRICEYILTNPERWTFDKENAAKTGIDSFDSWLDSEGEKSLRKSNKEAIVGSP